MLGGSGFLAFFSTDVRAIPHLHVSVMCISLVWSWLAAAWTCHRAFQWLGCRGSSAYVCWCSTAPHTLSNVTWVWKWWGFDVSRSSRKRFLFEKNKNNFHPLMVLKQRMNRSGRLKCLSKLPWVSTEPQAEENNRKCERTTQRQLKWSPLVTAMSFFFFITRTLLTL